MIQDTLEETKKLVWPEIEKYLVDPVYPKDFIIKKEYKEVANFFWTTVKEYPIRKGKYLRPTLVLLINQAFGKTTKNAIKTAAAMQLSEEWILVSDDIEDGSLQRRGKPAIQRVYGPEQAINAGDALEIIMSKVVIDNFKILPFDTAYKIAEEFHRMLLRTALGQGIEIKWFVENNTELSEDDLLFISDSKSGYYSIAGPMRLGAILGGATETQLDQITKFGVMLGRCFQLVDDILDLTSDFEGLKHKSNDIFEGKRTLMLAHLLRTATNGDRKIVVNILAKNRANKTQNEVDWIIQKMNQYGSIEYGRTLAKKFRDQARQLFDRDLGFLSHEPAKTKIQELMNFILERKY